MEVFFNEKCLDECPDVDLTIDFLYRNLKILDNEKIKTCTQIAGLKKWKEVLHSDFDSTTESYFYTLIQRFDECPEESLQFYYHYFDHQHHPLSISDNLIPSILVSAANKLLSSHLVVVLNLPHSQYTRRPHLPILKSPNNAYKEDVLVNIPCFDNALKIKQHRLLNEKIKGLIKLEMFDDFSKEFHKIYDSFDFSSWEPKSFTEDELLVPENSFPASKSELIVKEISSWKKIDRGTSGDDNAKRKEIGGTVCELHGYMKNILLSAHYGYEIYEAGYGNKKLLISLDVENALFEVLDENGIHKGAYNYSGQRKKHYKEKKDIESHSLSHIPKHMFIFKK